MKRFFIFLLLATAMTFGSTACSLFGSSDDETEAAEVAEEGEGAEGSDDYEDGEGEALASDDSGDDFADDEPASEDGAAEEATDIAVEDEFGDDDEFPDDEIGTNASGGAVAEVSDDDFADIGDEGTEVAQGEESLFVDEGEEGQQELPAEPIQGNEEQDLFAAEETVEESAPVSSFADAGDFGGAAMGSGLVPVKKMKPAAFKRAGANVNRLYVARPGDTMGTIAAKVYGTDRSADLYAFNSHFRGRQLKVGDKVYYSSPISPNDPEMKTYYEDNGIAPQYYTSQKGENVRGISKKLLGHERSWMEVFATNENVTSKWDIPAGTQIRYWPEGAASMAKAPAPAPAPEPEPVEEMPVEEVAEAMPEEIPAVDPAEVQEVAELDEPAEIEEISEEEEFSPPPAVGAVTPPPPPPAKTVTPPPPPPAPLANNAKPFAKPKAIGGPAGDDSMIMGALGGLLIFAAIILLVFIRRSRAKRVNFSQTQV